MILSRPAAAALFLVSVMFFWRFQVGVGNAGVPAYVALIPLVLLLEIPRAVLLRTLAVGAVALGAMLIAVLQGVTLTRPSVALAALVILLASWVGIGAAMRVSAADRWRILARLVRAVLVLQLAVQATDILGLDLFGNRTYPHYYLPIVRAPGLLAEPSHVAITFSPLLLAAFWPPARSFGGHLGRLDHALVFLILFLCPSATLLVVLALALALRIAALSPLLGVGLVLLPVLLWQNLDAVITVLPDAIADRLLTLRFVLVTGYFDEESNLSSVVLYGGYRAAMETLAEYPLGLGFLNMGAAYQLDGLVHYGRIAGDRNVDDGSSVLFKLATEFGWLGVGLAVYAVLAVWRYFTVERGDLTLGILTFPLFAFFARGASYLDGPVLISLALVVFGLGAAGRLAARPAWVRA